MLGERRQMNHVFISYARQDADFATVLRSALEKAGHKVWVDQVRISAGDDWSREIDEAIQTSKSLIVIMSPEAAKSEYVTYEWAYALGKGIRVVPVLLRTTSLHPRLQTIHNLDFSSHSARPWDRLLGAISRGEPGIDDRISGEPKHELTVEIAGSPEAVKKVFVLLHMQLDPKPGYIGSWNRGDEEVRALTVLDKATEQVAGKLVGKWNRDNPSSPVSFSDFSSGSDKGVRALYGGY
jgi:hypothetical protein